MAEDLCRKLVESFLESSWPSVKTLVEKLKEEKSGNAVPCFNS